MRWKDFLYYQQGEKIAVIILLFLILAALVINMLFTQRKSNQIVLAYNDSLILEFEKFRQGLKEKETDERQAYVSRENASSYSATVISSRSSQSSKSDESRSAPNYIRTEKLSSGESISLNETDTTLWKKIPGIGSAYAARIVKYSKSLGGFASKNQLREVYGVDNELYNRISPFVSEDVNYTKLQVNRLEFKELLSHPYLNYKQVQAIFNLRKKRGKITSLSELAILDEFTSEDIAKLEPYLDFR